MLVTIDIKEDKRIPFIMELIKSFDYITIIETQERDTKAQFIADLTEAFNDVKLYEQGKKQLKSAKALLNEL